MATYQDFAKGLLGYLGAPDTTQNEQFIIGWESAEGTKASYNPLAVANSPYGNPNFNSIGVDNFPDLQTGEQATASRIEGVDCPHCYDNILQALRANNAGALGFPAGNPSGGVYGDLGVWVHGTRGSDVNSYVGNIFGNLNSGGRTLGSNGGGSTVINPDGTTTTTTTPCPYANVPVFGGVYCAGWNFEQSASSGNPLSLIPSVVQNVLLFAAGALLFGIGFYLLASKAGDNIIDVALNGASKTAGAGSGESGSAGNGKSSGHKSGIAERAASVEKVAAVAA